MPADVIHTDLSQTSKSLAVIGGFIVIYGLISYVVKERLYLSEPLLAVTLGILVGPYALNWVDPLSWGTQEDTNELTYQFTRIIVGIQVLFTGISLPKAYLWKEKLSLTILLFGIMTAAWFVTALLIWGLIPDLTYLESLTIAAAVTPTDPVLASSITNGRYAEKHVPANVRNIIVAESGANDGLGFPFLYLGIYLLARKGVDSGTSVGTEVGRWVYAVVIYQILLSICFGALLGYLARKTLRWAEAHSYIDKANFFAYGLGLAFFTLGTTGLFGSDDILACFIAGNSFTWDDWFRLRTEDNDFQEIIDSVLNLAVFVYIGAIIPWSDYSDETIGLTGWRVVVLAITVLLLRRPPWVMVATKLIPALRDWREAIFAGWFGPIGVGAVFYMQVALRELPDDGTRDRVRRLYTPLVLFCVFGSVFAHGITIPISKLGPRVVRRTATLTQTFPLGSRTTTLSQAGVTKNGGETSTMTTSVGVGSGTASSEDEAPAPAQPETPEKVPDRTPKSLLSSIVDALGLRSTNFSTTPNPTRTPATTTTDPADATSVTANTHLPPPSLVLPTSQPSSSPTPPTLDPPAARIEEMDIAHAVSGAFEREAAAERVEADDEAQKGWVRVRERQKKRDERRRR